jgi:hypothetical protein
MAVVLVVLSLTALVLAQWGRRFGAPAQVGAAGPS